MRSSSLFLLTALLLALAAPLAAQERPASADTLHRSGLPPEVQEEIVAFFNAPGTLHFTGSTRVPAERVVTGDVAVLGGPLVVGGRIEGRVVVVNGDVELLPGASVEGDLTVVGGEITGAEEARVGGEIVAYSERLRYRREREGIALAEPRERSRRSDRSGRGSFLVTTGQSYNRVEGLPIHFGPVVQTPGSNPLRVSAQAIYRTEDGPPLETDQWGHRVSVEQFLGGRRAFRVGAGVHSLVTPIEGWHLTDTENGLSTLFFQRDFRDHYERKGWSAFAVLEPRGAPFSLTAEYRSELHGSRAAGDPWAVFEGTDEWRPQPLAGEGRLRSLLGSARIDTRNDRQDPSTGWYVSGEVERALESELVRPALVSLGPADVLRAVSPPVAYGEFTRGLVDVRRYNRVSPDSRLNLRLLAGGSLDGSPLPAQRQHALGGEGSLPGYSLFSLDCGARSGRVYRGSRAPLPENAATGGAVYFPSYGCDRFALLQGEYRGKLSFRFDWHDHSWHDHEEEGDDHEWDASLDWVTFVDVGRGWAVRGENEETAVDAGIGLLFDRVGVYAALPLRDGRGVNLFVRIGPRF